MAGNDLVKSMGLDHEEDARSSLPRARRRAGRRRRDDREVQRGFFYGLIIMVIGDCHESGTRLTVTRFAESHAPSRRKSVVVPSGQRSSVR